MRRTLLTGGALVASVALLAGCGTGSAPEGESAGPVTLQMWSWDPSMPEIAEVWNASHPDIQVEVTDPAGGNELVSRILTAHKSGDAADIVKVEYQALPALVSNGVAADITAYTEDAVDSFTPAAFDQVSFEGKVYGLPQDFAPLVFFYRNDIFEQYGLEVPTSWDEYAETARALHEADPDKYLGTFSSVDPGWFTGLAQQAGANWWSATDDTWKVAIDDAESVKVADYWQGLISEGVIKGEPFWSPQWNKEMDDGTYAGWISGAWAPAQFGGIAPNTAGKWTMTALPDWNAGDATTGIWGGSATAVTTDSEHPEEAAAFVEWFNTSDEALALQVEKINIFPAAINGQKLDALQTPPAYMPNQPDYYATVAQISEGARTFDLWGPNATVTFGAYNDGFASAIESGSSFADVLASMQETTVADMEKLGFSVEQ